MIEKVIAAIEEHDLNVFDVVEMDARGMTDVKLRKAGRANNSYSVTKLFTATAVGILVREGRLSVRDRILPHFPDAPRVRDEKLELVTVEHLLLHTMGHDTGTFFEDDRYRHGTQDWTNYILSQPLPLSPGERMVYTNAGYYLLSVLVERITGVTLAEFLRTELFDPLGFQGWAWSCCPMGHTMGATGLFLRTEDMAKLGRLYLEGGSYNGRRYLTEEWVRDATATHRTDAGRGYGYGFWRNDGQTACYGDGAHGQLLLLLPDSGTVIAMHGYDDFSLPDFVDDIIKR